MMLPRVIGHRGAAEAAPENTLTGFRAAHAQGARWVEFDAKLSADNHVVLLHDDDLDRTTDAKGPARLKSLAELKALDAGSWFSERFAGERLATLEEALALFQELDLAFNIEIKPCPGRERETAEIVLAELMRLWPHARPEPLVSSFAVDSLKAIRAAAPLARIGLLLEDHPDNWRDFGRRLNAQTINIWDKLATPAWIGEIKQEGYGLLVYTVNDAKRANELFVLGVDGVFTDAPGRILAGVSEWL